MLIKILEKQDYQEVWKAVNMEDEKLYTLRKIDKYKINSNPYLEDLLLSELTIMHSIKHPNILQLHDFIESKNNFYVVVDFCDEGNLEEIMQSKEGKYFSEEEALMYLKQVVNGFVELRKNKILHRNAVMKNMFVKEERVIIGDFGYAK